jgi:hypothetical protein
MLEKRLSADPRKREVLGSLAILGAVVTLALFGLAADRNWPKILRVSLAYIAYCGSLVAFLRYRTSPLSTRNTIQLHWFTIAGAAAGIVSGIVRPRFDLSVLVLGTLAAATLLATVHCFALRTWRRLLPGDRTPSR